jgi:hypothetical protein
MVGSTVKSTENDMTTDTSTRQLTEDELELVSGGRINQVDPDILQQRTLQGAAGLDPLDLLVRPAQIGDPPTV